MKEQSLNGEWLLHYAPEHTAVGSANTVKTDASYNHITAMVPGNVELDLLAAHQVEEPFYGTNLYNFRPYEFYEWWYTRSFTVETELLQSGANLRLDGVDTYATVFINGNEIGKTDNMMLAYCFDISEYLKEGSNEIAIHIQSTINVARTFEYPMGVRGPGWEHTDEMICVRKPGHMFGWDIAPRFVSAGLWRGVSLQAKRTTYLKETYITTLHLEQDEATVLMKCRFVTDDATLDDFAIRIRGVCEESSFCEILHVKFCSDELTFRVKNPKLWWPKGYGDANVYTTTIELLHHDVVVDYCTQQFGIRLLEVLTNFVPGDAGEFKVMANGVPILCKGANWVPLDAFHSRDAQRYEKALALFNETGCNIVRCWGGNVYEDHAFYDICDTSGIMVWQDFSLACAIYPQTDAFAKTIEQEAAAIVVKLRNHPCILLWSGDNEVDAMYYNFGYNLPHVRNNRISREILPRVTASHDPIRFFLPSSPYVPLTISGDLNVPEQHNWGPRDYFKGDFYKHSTAHFTSEIGYHGCPSVTSLKKFIPTENLWPIQNDAWDAHNTEYTRCIRDRGYDRNQLMADQVTDMFGVCCKNLEQLAMLSQISQAEAKKFFIEQTRLKKWRKTGIIWWNMLDCWPQISDAVVDYYFHKKLAFYYIKRVQQPICLLCDEPKDWHHAVYLCNDSNRTIAVSYTVKDGETGEILCAGTEISPANENIQIGKFKTFSGVQRLIVMEWTCADAVQGANHFITGYPAFDAVRYKKWLHIIEKIALPFDSVQCFA
ncbi:MAG: hypothetical protein RSD54_05895 [Ruthenibacterium sp.]